MEFVVGIAVVGIIIALIIRSKRKKRKAAEEAERQRLAVIRQKAYEESLRAERARSKASVGKTLGSITGRLSKTTPDLKKIPSRRSTSRADSLAYDDTATNNALLFGAIAASTWDNSSSNDNSSSSSGYSSSSSSDYGSSSSSSSSYDSGSSSSYSSGDSGGGGSW